MKNHEIDYKNWRIYMCLFLIICIPILFKNGNVNLDDWINNFEEMMQAKYAELYINK